MRYVKKDPKDIPPSLQTIKAVQDLEEIAKGKKELISDKIYKGDYKDENGKSQSQVRDYLNKYYFEKCAYCEDFCKAEIEHYRPKKGVDETPFPAHNGYYWLCYEWSNLVPSCRYCNTEGGKGNKFPIIQTTKRVFSPSFNGVKLDITQSIASNNPLIDEEPFLLHPEIDTKPEIYLGFTISTQKDGVEIIGIDDSQRGAKTIEICNLNRTNLKLKRLENVYYHLKKRINFIFDLITDGQLPKENIGKALNLIFKEIEKESEQENLTFTLLRKFIIKNTQNFESHFVPYLDNKDQQQITIQAFKNYKSGH